MGGKIWVESKEGEGSTFTFTVILQTIGEEEERELIKAKLARHRSSNPPSPASARKERRKAGGKQTHPHNHRHHHGSKEDNGDSLEGEEDSNPNTRMWDKFWGSAQKENGEREGGTTSSTTTTTTPTTKKRDKEKEKVTEEVTGKKGTKRTKDQRQPISLLSWLPGTTSETQISKPTESLEDRLMVRRGTHTSVDPFTGKAPWRILLAEDNIVNQKVALRLLQKIGYEDVVVVSDGYQVHYPSLSPHPPTTPPLACTNLVISSIHRHLKLFRLPSIPTTPI